MNLEKEILGYFNTDFGKSKNLEAFANSKGEDFDDEQVKIIIDYFIQEGYLETTDDFFHTINTKTTVNSASDITEISPSHSYNHKFPMMYKMTFSGKKYFENMKEN